MRRLALALVALPLMAASLGACHDRDDEGMPGVAASGSGSNRTYPITDFSAVELAGSDNVDIRVGTGFSVRAEGSADELDKVRVRKQGDALRIDRQGNSWGSHRSVKLFVTLPRLAAATLSGSGDMAVDRIEGPAFKGQISGSGNLAIAAITADAVDLSTAGSGDISAAGAVKTLTVNVAGSGDVDAAKLTAGSATVSVAGSGDVSAMVDGTASVSVLGSGDVDLGPKARCSISKMGSGEVHCGG